MRTEVKIRYRSEGDSRRVDERAYNVVDVERKKGVMVLIEVKGSDVRVSGICESMLAFIQSRPGEKVLYSDGYNLKMKRYCDGGAETVEFRLMRKGKDIKKLMAKMGGGELSRSSINYYTESYLPYLEKCRYRVVKKEEEVY